MLIHVVIINFFALILYLEIGIHILILNPRNRINRMFFLTCLLFSVWVFGYFMFVQSGSFEAAWFWIRFASVGFYLMPPVAAHFFLTLAFRKRSLKMLWLLALLYLPAAFYVARMLAGKMFFETIVYAQDFHIWQGFSEQRNWTFWVYPLYLMTCFLLIVALSVVWCRKAAIPIEKRQSRTVLAVNVLTFVAGFAGSVLLAATRGVHFRKFSLVYSAVSIVWVTGIWYSILKYKLFIIQSNPIIPQILSNIPVPAMVTDLNVASAFVNEEFIKLTGCAAAEKKRVAVGDFIGEGLAERLKRSASGTEDAESGETLSASVVCGEASRVMNVSIHPIDNDKGDTIGFLLKFYPEDAVSELHERYKLTKREIEIAKLLAQGLTNREICDKLFISLATIKTHVINIYRKLDIRNKVELTNILSQLNKD